MVTHLGVYPTSKWPRRFPRPTHSGVSVRGWPDMRGEGEARSRLAHRLGDASVKHLGRGGIMAHNLRDVSCVYLQFRSAPADRLSVRTEGR